MTDHEESDDDHENEEENNEDDNEDDDDDDDGDDEDVDVDGVSESDNPTTCDDDKPEMSDKDITDSEEFLRPEPSTLGASRIAARRLARSHDSSVQRQQETADQSSTARQVDQQHLSEDIRTENAGRTPAPLSTDTAAAARDSYRRRSEMKQNELSPERTAGPELSRSHKSNHRHWQQQEKLVLRDRSYLGPPVASSSTNSGQAGLSQQ